MDSGTTLGNYPPIDWKQVATFPKKVPQKPDIEFEKKTAEEAFDEFRRLSRKVASHSYDIPEGHSVIVAYAKYSDPSEPSEAIGVITFCLADPSVNKPTTTTPQTFMDAYFHQLSFLFVHTDYQRRGVGSQLVNKAITVIKDSNIKRPVHIEAAKSAVKFFRKMRFIRRGEVVCTNSRRGSSLFWNFFCMELCI
ncbi:uncharacterized protein LOC131945905 [Physella acuta]|uniref:uncharacterized protein LOC131945905 n=1 Tax=Physella acuta TaxID=109671 RepID=UPI0027DD981C|nr:uncharacterized protein LOC131945905 [Physella acuta]XP_059162520.1 uncharacterized protein LOC131945905 [Physella acuta]